MSKKANLINRKSIQIEWGDCDPAKIVYYPRYLAYFDACTAALFKKAGLPKWQMLKTYRNCRYSAGGPARIIQGAIAILGHRSRRI